MKARWASALLWLALLAPPAQAQLLSGADLSAYQAMIAALGQAVEARPQSASRSLSELQAAQHAFERWQPDLKSRTLSANLSDALSASRAALARSPADLEAQVVQARGLMRAALYTQTLTLLSQETDGVTSAQGQWRLLAKEFGLPESQAAQLGRVPVEQLQRLLERAAAQKVRQYLQRVRVSDRQQAYLNLTRAASWLTPVQDAPEASGLHLEQVAQALSQVTAGDAAAASSVAALTAQAVKFEQALAQAAPSAPASTALTAQPVRLPSAAEQGESPKTIHLWQVGLTFLLAAFSAYPLYLLNLAFGSRNPYWRGIFAGMMLLLLPLLVLGIGGLLSLLPVLSAPLLRLGRSAAVWPAWALSTGLSLAALTYGFRGLCRQFGLIGSSSAPEPPSSLDWDEEV